MHCLQCSQCWYIQVQSQAIQELPNQKQQMSYSCQGLFLPFQEAVFWEQDLLSLPLFIPKQQSPILETYALIASCPPKTWVSFFQRFRRNYRTHIRVQNKTAPYLIGASPGISLQLLQKPHCFLPCPTSILEQ